MHRDKNLFSKKTHNRSIKSTLSSGIEPIKEQLNDDSFEKKSPGQKKISKNFKSGNNNIF